MITIYGIPNCDTVKKSRQWLADHNIDYVFHDYKKSGVPEKELKRWIAQLGWEILLNTKGTTWRTLDESLKTNINQQKAINIMLAHPSIIKRPVLDMDYKYVTGFSERSYRELFKK